MNFPSKPWTDGQQAELVEGSIFQYDATRGAWLLAISKEQAAVTSLEVKVDSDLNVVSASITTLGSDLDALTTTVTNNKTSADNSIAEILARLDSDYALNNLKHAIQEALISGNTNAIAVIRTKQDNDSDTIAAIDARLATAEGEIDTLQTQMTTVLTNASDNAAAIANLRLEADSDVDLIQANAAIAAAQASTITEILTMLDSDGVNIQAIRTDYEAADAAINARLDSDSIRIQSLQTQIDAIGTGSLASIISDHDSDTGVTNAAIAALQISVTNNDSDIAKNASDIIDAGKTYKQTSAPTSPNANDMWFDTSNNSLFAWDATNSVWVQVIS